MKILDCMQGSPEWVEARAGRVTASRFGDILTDKTLKIGAAAKTYCYELVAETLLGGPDPWKMEGETVDMRRGTYTENEGRNYLAFHLDCEVQQVGCIIHDNDRWLCSPDGLIGESSGVEIKCPAPKTQIKWVLDGGLPLEHRAQVHGAMIVTGRDHWRFLSYCCGLPPLLVEVERDEYTAKLEAALVEFNGMYAEMLAKIEAGRLEAAMEAIDRKGAQMDEKKDKGLRSFLPAEAS